MSAEKSYLLTGASSGIGAALCRRLLNGGASVTAVSRRQPAVRGDDLDWISCDLSDGQEVTALCYRLARRRAPFDGMIMCHGYGDFGSLEEFSEQRIRRLVDTNLVSTFI